MDSTKTLIYLSELILQGGVKISQIDYSLNDCVYRLHSGCIYSDNLLYAKLIPVILAGKDLRSEGKCFEA